MPGKGRPFTKGDPRAGRPKGRQNKATEEQKVFLRGILESDEYRQSFRARVVSGDAPHLETLMHHYVMGKPRDTLAIEKVPPILVIDELNGDT